MKFKLFLATAAVLAIAVSAFAKEPETVSVKAQRQLTSEFKDAQQVSWSTSNNLFEASFKWNGQKLHAFYNQDGEEVALSREISADELPLKALQAIHEKYNDYKAGEVIELTSTDEGLSYYLSLEKGNKKVILNVSPNGLVSVFK